MKAKTLSLLDNSCYIRENKKRAHIDQTVHEGAANKMYDNAIIVSKPSLFSQQRGVF